MTDNDGRLHLICERDVGLFSLIQQVIATIPWALAEGRTPIEHFGPRTCYWTPNGHHGAESVWEYYFEPLHRSYGSAMIPHPVRRELSSHHPLPDEVGFDAGNGVFVSCHFGDHPELDGATLTIPYEWDDPSDSLRRAAKAILDRFVRPREYIRVKAERFFERHMAGHDLIGAHVRGTDAISGQEVRRHRQGSLVLRATWRKSASSRDHPRRQDTRGLRRRVVRHLPRHSISRQGYCLRQCPSCRG